MAHSQRMDILMICAAPSAPVQSRGGPSELRMFSRREAEVGIRMMDAVQADLNAMYDYCKSSHFVTRSRMDGRQRVITSKVNVVRLLVNNRHLSPKGTGDKVEGCVTDPEIFRSKEELREAVREFLSDDDLEQAPNLMIYYSGHGIHDFNKHLGRSEEALEMQVSVQGQTSTIHYTDSELTKDINEHLRRDRKLYLVIDACHAEGMLNQWQLQTPLQFVVLFAGANTEVRADYSSNGGAFTQKFIKVAQPGRQLCEIAQQILVDLFDSGKRRSPAVRYGEPKLSVQKYLA